ncbi:hypothetical protein LWC08_00050 [Desulfobaculum bizertense]|uniref:hypothetical protein n=1 Tax=Desulfobaculum bizertense TaxID=376490 RepID=UPI001F1A7DB2|nr:hypothetical protein [Desulfobaculum bizertense]UIJ38001.1 hypothetical protein LWC08_00050 [Desulfobaculum bizertense]
MSKELLQATLKTFRDATEASIELFKVMVPIIIIVKLLQEFDLIQYLAIPLGPLMQLVGLPASMGLVWATGLLVNNYSGLVVYISLAPAAMLNVGQVTVLATMLLIAHALPVECKVAQKCGPSLWFQVLFRCAVALLAGVILHLIYSNFGLLTEPAQVLWNPGTPPATLIEWGIDQLKTLVSIYGIIVALMFMMKLLNKLRITEAINFVLRPILTFMGIGPQAATLTVVGLTLGLSYGSGLIMHEIREGAVPQRDIFSAMTLMGVAHSLIEDPLLMVLIGADFSGIMWGRLIVSLGVMALLVKLVKTMPRPQFMKIFMNAA